MKPETVIESVSNSTGVVLTMWQAAEVGNAIRDNNWTLVRSRLVGLVGRSDEVKATEALRDAR